jgi:hypothetical protein
MNQYVTTLTDFFQPGLPWAFSPFGVEVPVGLLSNQTGSVHDIMRAVSRRASSVAEILGKNIPPGRRDRIFSLDFIRLKWPTVVGTELARRSEPISLGECILNVRVTDAAWGRMILRLQRDILPRLSKTLGPDRVRRIRFIKDGEPLWGDETMLCPHFGGTSALDRRPIAGTPLQIEEAATTIRDADLRALVTRTASRYLAARAARRR